MRQLAALVISMSVALGVMGTAAWAQPPSQIELKVEGMTCPGCEATVEAILTGVHGVVEVRADRTTETAVVRFDPQRTTPEEMVEAINGRTYYLASVSGPSGADAGPAPRTSTAGEGTPSYTPWILTALTVAGIAGASLISKRWHRREPESSRQPDHIGQ
jgi:copper chaperone CopZ